MKSLFSAKNLAELKGILKDGADLRQRDDRGLTLLHHLAMRKRPVDMLAFALDRGLKINAGSKNGATLLHLAAINKASAEFMTLALERGAAINALNKEKWTPLGCAFQQGNLEGARFLIERGARLGPEDFPLHDLARGNAMGGEAAARLILDHKLIDPNARDPEKETALQCARRNQDAKLVALLSQYGAQGATKPTGYAKINAASARSLFQGKKSPLTKESLELLSVAFDLAGGDVNFHQGNLAMKKPLSLDAPLIVDGDLVVDGWLLDTHGVDHNILFVTGDVRCKGYIGEAEMVVLGSFRIQGDAWLMSLGDNTLHIAGDLQANIVASDGHWLDLHGKLAAKAIVGGLEASGKTRWKPSLKHQALHPSLYKLEATKSELKEMEPDEVDDCCELKESVIVSWIKKGRPLRRS